VTPVTLTSFHRRIQRSPASDLGYLNAKRIGRKTARMTGIAAGTSGIDVRAILEKTCFDLVKTIKVLPEEHV